MWKCVLAMDIVWVVNAIAEMDIMGMIVDSVMDSFKMTLVLINVHKDFMQIISNVHLVTVLAWPVIDITAVLPVKMDWFLRKLKLMANTFVWSSVNKISTMKITHVYIVLRTVHHVSNKISVSDAR